MLLNSVFDRFVQESPVAVMVRGLLEHVLTPASVDALFEQHAEKQYTRELLFSEMVDLMGQVVCGIYPSAIAAYQKQGAAFYRIAHGRLQHKLNGVEPPVSAALTRQTAAELTAVIDELGGALPDLLPSYRVKIRRRQLPGQDRTPSPNCGRSRRVRCPASRWWCRTRRRCWRSTCSRAGMGTRKSVPCSTWFWPRSRPARRAD